jgi:hypothetical protein
VGFSPSTPARYVAAASVHLVFLRPFRFPLPQVEGKAPGGGNLLLGVKSMQDVRVDTAPLHLLVLLLPACC